MSITIDPAKIAKRFQAEILETLRARDPQIKLVGFLGSDSLPSKTYADYTRRGCEAVGVKFELRQFGRLELEDAIETANRDTEVHGIIVYYPILNAEYDSYLKDLVNPRKDIEGLNTYWVRKLYQNERLVESVGESSSAKAILPCTPLAIIKLIETSTALHVEGNRPLKGRRFAIFNRSEVVGRPLAAMLSNDGAEVYSFDIDGAVVFRQGKMTETKTGRSEALADADCVITGVPSRSFELIKAKEITANCVGINFSTMRNFEDQARKRCAIFIPRVGPMTVTMALRNTMRLYDNFHKPVL